MIIPKFACGCSITKSLFYTDKIISINLCWDHVLNEYIQSMMNDIEDLLEDLQDDDLNHLIENVPA